MVPAMIYLLRVPTNVAIGTSLFQIVFVTAATTVLHSTTNFTVDVVLAVLLMVGGVIGVSLAQAIKRPSELVIVAKHPPRLAALYVTRYRVEFVAASGELFVRNRILIVGSSTDKVDFGNPLDSESYRLCVYDGGTLLFDMGANASAAFWRDTIADFMASEFIADTFGRDFRHIYGQQKLKELRSFYREVTTLEYAWYLRQV